MEAVTAKRKLLSKSKSIDLKTGKSSYLYQSIKTWPGDLNVAMH